MISIKQFKSGMARARVLAEQVEKSLVMDFPELKSKLCLALVGMGSECLVLDDEISTDHDSETRCQLFLNNQLYQQHYEELEKYFSHHFKEKIEIWKISGFYLHYTSYPEGPKTIAEFRKVPDDFLCTATNGEVFCDYAGDFTKIRSRLLKYYPKDLQYKYLAYHLNFAAQSGQYNYSRLLKRKDKVAATLALAEFIQHYMQIVHILNNKYMPFYKWAFRHTKELALLGEWTYKEMNVLMEMNEIEKINQIEKMCGQLVEILNQKGYTDTQIDFLTYQANQISEKIIDKQLRLEDNWVR